MKQFFGSLLKFIPFAIALYILMVIVWKEYLPETLSKNVSYHRGTEGGGYLFSRLEEAKKMRDVDILFLGSSHAYRGFDTRMYSENGWKTFNLGSSSQTPLQTKLLLETYLERLNPKLIVFEVYPGIFELDGVESTLDLISNEKIDIKIAALAVETHNAKSLNTLIYGTFRQITGQNEGFQEPPTDKTDTYISGGYVQRDKSYFRHLSYTPRKWNFNEHQKEAFESILQLLKEKNIPVYLVQAPMTSANYCAYTNNKVFDMYMKKKGNYINFNGKLPLDDSLHFYDANHMNQDGVKIFNDRLIRFLKSEIKF